MNRTHSAFLIVILAAPAASAVADSPSWLVRGTSGLVATDSIQASRAGLEILQAGGNAIDAAVAASFALAVTRPYSTGLGGGGFMIARFADGRVVVQDFRETAPIAATHDMYVEAARRDPQGVAPSRYGHLAVAVPGLVAGRCQALAQHGTMPLARVIQPAILLAIDGFPVDQNYVDTIGKVVEVYERHPSLKTSCGYVWRTHLREGRSVRVGDTLKQPALARLLKGLARGGRDFFYKGSVARAVAREMKRFGGIVEESDLLDYRVRERKAIRTTYREYEVIGMPPPSSGGVAIAEILNILEVVDPPAAAPRDHDLLMHHRIEAMKHAFADRARWLGDADFADVPVDRLTSKAYARRLALGLQDDAAAAPESYGVRNLPDDAGTSHLCVVDRWGNVVVSSETVNTSFGSLAAVDDWGLILNNQMDDFVSEPGKPNAYGLVQSARNAIAPGKRPLSSMAPTIVLRGGKPHLLLGASGGPRIITSVLSVLLGVLDDELSLEQAILRLRPHHQWQPNLVYFDDDPPDAIAKALTRRGHKLSHKRKTSVVQAILKTKDGWIAASDPRKGGRPAGY